jgi:Ran GTPase-activating protein (RanGAP) involved in mRNA processing and transport
LRVLAEMLTDSCVRRLVLRGNAINATAMQSVCAGAALVDELVLAENHMGDAGASVLCDWLVERQRGPLRLLDVSDNEIGEAGGMALATAVLRTDPELPLALATAGVPDDPRPSCVVELVVSRNAIGWRAGAALLLGAAAGRLRSLALAGTQLSEDALPQLLLALGPQSVLRSLDLSANLLDDACAKALRQAVAVNTRITSLQLGKNRRTTLHGSHG